MHVTSKKTHLFAARPTPLKGKKIEESIDPKKRAKDHSFTSISKHMKHVFIACGLLNSFFAKTHFQTSEPDKDFVFFQMQGQAVFFENIFQSLLL